jgi:tripeptidyl-peptidase I
VPDLDQLDINQNSNEPYLDFLHYIHQQDVLPQTITTSYGEDEQSVPSSYAMEVCSLFGQLGARGVSVGRYFFHAPLTPFQLYIADTLLVFSSGHTGVASACQTNDGKNTTRFLPIFPAACPYVTSIRATRNVEPEVVMSFSSGGFSDLFPRPDYQNHAVNEFFEYLGDQWKGLYNPNGRGFPDVAAQGVRFHVIDKNGGPAELDLQFSGTSASAPTFASIIALLNNARLSTGLLPLGFLNPWIYSTGRHAMNASSMAAPLDVLEQINLVVFQHPLCLVRHGKRSRAGIP